ncbi:MAG: PLD nuclease N-terminal domain-containing protein [Verrucomicrobiota bacterium]
MSLVSNIGTKAVWLVAIVLTAIALFFLTPLLLGALGWLLFIALPVAFTIAGLVSCLRSDKAGGLKLLWMIVILLAPFFGPLLWFLWGKKHT